MKKTTSGIFLLMGMIPLALANQETMVQPQGVTGMNILPETEVVAMAGRVAIEEPKVAEVPVPVQPVKSAEPSLQQMLDELSRQNGVHGQSQSQPQVQPVYPSQVQAVPQPVAAQPQAQVAATTPPRPTPEEVQAARTQAKIVEIQMLAQAAKAQVHANQMLSQINAGQAGALANQVEAQAQALQAEAQAKAQAQQAQAQQAQQVQVQQAQPSQAPMQTQAQPVQQQYPQEISGQQTAPQPINLPEESQTRVAAPLPSTLPANTSTMTPAQFQAWLQSHGYTDNRANASQPRVATRPVNLSANPTSSGSIQTFQHARAKKPASHHSTYLKPKVLNYEQGQRVMLKSVPKSHIPPIPDSNIAFNMMMQQNMPLTPQQVVQLRQQIDVAQRAAATPPNIPPKPVSSTVMVNLAPGTTPPAIRLAQGYVSSLVFVDSTSQPWPIAAFDIGNPKAVNIQWDGKSNILLLQAVSAYSDGDIVVRLVGNPTPITLELIAGQRVVDYRVDLHVPGIGPNSKDIPMGTALPNNPNQLLLGVLDGIAPAGSRTLTVAGADAQAWLLGEKLYLRTRLTLLSPGWVATMVSPDGMHAYELPKTSSVLVSRYGEPAELKIEGF